MLKNFIYSFVIAACFSTSTIYSRNDELVTESSNIVSVSSVQEQQLNQVPLSKNVYLSAGPSAQTIEIATPSSESTISLVPQSTTGTVTKPDKPIEATSGAVTSLTSIIEPSIKAEEVESGTVLGTTDEPTALAKVVVASPVPTPIAAAPQLAPHELDALFQKYGTEYGVSWEKLKVIAKCESGYNAAIVSKNGLYGGMYQYVASTWSGTRKQMGLDPNPNLRFNAEEAIRTTAYKISVGGTGPWPVCGKK